MIVRPSHPRNGKSYTGDMLTRYWLDTELTTVRFRRSIKKYLLCRYNAATCEEYAHLVKDTRESEKHSPIYPHVA